jgi:FKBP12-rapamycin complex-associated protein
VPKFARAGHVLSEFVRGCALPYLEDDHPEIRQAAALTCCRLFVRDPICYQSSNHSIEVISEVLDKLLTVGIADPGKFYQSSCYVAIIYEPL